MVYVTQTVDLGIQGNVHSKSFPDEPAQSESSTAFIVTPILQPRLTILVALRLLCESG